MPVERSAVCHRGADKADALGANDCLVKHDNAYWVVRRSDTTFDRTIGDNAAGGSQWIGSADGLSEVSADADDVVFLSRSDGLSEAGDHAKREEGEDVFHTDEPIFTFA